MKPRATYRIQFHKDFGFDRAGRLAPYLERLGVSHVYASPWLKARPGTSHGYDIVDHHALNSELGDEATFFQMVATLKAHRLGQILDFVPNHMSVGGADNPLWLDVLEWGRDSAHSGWFDIDWQADGSRDGDKLLVPLLGDQYGVELYQAKLTLSFDEREGSFAVWVYGTHKLPICPVNYNRILGDKHPELERLGDAFANLPEWRLQVVSRARELKAELSQAVNQSDDVREAIRACVARFNGTPGDESSWRDLHLLIQEQHWRAAHFRVAADDINYRRFFDVNDLAGLRMELPEVFNHAHALVLRLLSDGTLDGLRIDHVDGLLNPKEYLQRLRARVPSQAGEPFYLVVEKILAPHEGLRSDWPVDGTTGYEFLNLLLGVMIDSAGEAAIDRHYIEFSGETKSFVEVVRESKLRIMRNEMASELNMLAHEATRVAHQNPATADFTRHILHRAIREVVACFPVYRTYVDTAGPPSAEDLRDLNRAITQACASDNDVDASVFDFVRKLLSGELVAASHSGFSRQSVLRCAMRLQQFSGPVMAKGLEDTAFYRYNRFIALNEVGGRPDQFGMTLAAFHKANALRLKQWPGSMLSTSTHDTKRGEDTRARLAVLSEIPDEWARQTRSWSRILRARRGEIGNAAPPDRNDEYLFYQLLTGTWPAELTGCSSLDPTALETYRRRIQGAMTKSIREAKFHSTWTSPNKPYEDAVRDFVDGALDPDISRAFLGAFLPFQERVARLGVENSLFQTVLKLTVPGVPDIYQGAELWDLSMVDPDNRRPVDYDIRTRLLDKLHSGVVSPSELFSCWKDGAVKLFVTSTLLRFRTAEAELFATGGYEPLSVTGPNADCICAFARQNGGRAIVVLAARFPARREVESNWSGTVVSLPKDLPGTKFRNLFTAAEIPNDRGELDIGLALDGLNVAVLTPDR
jgi:(1->4)-alpha-D-glucan 1-alpha-D-glucosylmutase